MEVIRGGVDERLTSKSLTFTGASGLGQSTVDVPFFTVTGEVLIRYLVPFCTENLVSAGGGTLALAILSTATLVAATTATEIDVNNFWLDTAPNAYYDIPSSLNDIVLTANLIGVVAIANITGGTIRFDVIWRPLSSDGLLTPA